MKRKLPQIIFTPRVGRRKNAKDKPFARYLTNGYFLFLAGIILGCIVSIFAKLPAFIGGSTRLTAILSKTQEFDFGGYLFECFAICMTSVAIVFVLGFTAAAAPVIYAVPVFRGIGFGVMMTEIYSAFDLKGALICLVAVIPYAAVTVVSICVLSMDAVLISASLTRFLFAGDVSGVNGTRLRAYFVKLIISSAAAALGTFVHCAGVKLLLPVM
ncbi:MAG: hypothetical protein J5756_04880 [Clostridia bacterium]|nr:hypothetical protein [Clostridia bacterium]